VAHIGQELRLVLARLGELAALLLNFSQGNLAGEIVMSKDEIEQMAAQMLAEMPNARQQVAIALEHELHERALEWAGRESLSATPSKQSFKF